MQYTTLENLKTYLGITGTEQDDELNNLISIGTELIDLELGDNLEAQTLTRRIDGNGSNRVYLEAIPTNVSSAYYTTNDGYSRSSVDLAPDPIDGYTVRLGAIVPKGIRNVKVTYSKGYDSVPKDMEEFFLLYLKKLKDGRDTIANGWDSSTKVKTKKAEGLSVTYFSPEEVASLNASDPFATSYNNILKKYRIFSYHITT